MTEHQNYMPPVQEEEEMTIDWMEYVRKLWDIRKLLFKVAALATVVGVIIALTTPKNYTVNVVLAPEAIGKGTSKSMASFASMLGLGNISQGNEADALNVLLYPQILSSNPFILDLLDTPVSTINNADTTLMGYLTEYTKQSMISKVMSLPMTAIGSFINLFKNEEETGAVERKSSHFHLTKEEYNAIKGVRSLISSEVDKKTGITNISVTMQDPMVAALLADTVLQKLKEHITQYRVAKANDDLIFWEKIYEQRKSEYYASQKKYAEYADANKNVILESVRIEQSRLQNEASLAYQIYNQVATQLQNARAKVQECKPAFAVVEPASVPLKHSGPSGVKTLLGVLFMALAFTVGWELYMKDKYDELRKSFKQENTDEVNSSNE